LNNDFCKYRISIPTGLAYTLYYMVCHEAQENGAYFTGFDYANVYAGSEKLEDLLASCTFRAPHRGHCHGDIGVGSSANYRQLAEHGN
jgi:hypothetical protein